ncbi:MAG: hypothetical protein K2X61_02905 [Caulobacteraceae bacterium]|nr:hypothetical protein [Caulobacteraceae bacterium]
MPQTNRSHPTPVELGDATIAALNGAGGADAAVIAPVTLSSVAFAEPFSTEGYGAVIFQVTANVSGNTIVVQGSNDGGTTWINIPFRLADAATLGSFLSLAGSPGAALIIPSIVMPRMRWGLTAQSGGNTTVAVGLKRGVDQNTLTAFISNTVGVSALAVTFWNESTTALTAGATFTGTSRDTGATAGSGTFGNRAYFNAFAFADQAGNVRIEVSNDNSTWRRATADQAVAANTPVTLSIPVMTRHHRVVYVNGGTNQGAFMCNTSYSAA